MYYYFSSENNIQMTKFIVNDINSDIDSLDDLEYIEYFIIKNKFKIQYFI